MSYRDEEFMLERAKNLAGACQRAWANKNQVQQTLAHLENHRSVAATLQLLDALPESCFAVRFGSTRRQYEGLKTCLGAELRGQRDWRRMARLLGWTCRFMEMSRNTE